MIFNWIYGMEMDLGTASKTFSGVQAYSVLEMELTVNPLVILMRTTAGGVSDLCAYYRTDPDGSFSLRASDGQGDAYCRLVSCVEGELLLSCSGATAEQPANIECIALGVKL